jgi:hypothetical protein
LHDPRAGARVRGDGGIGRRVAVADVLGERALDEVV